MGRHKSKTPEADYRRRAEQAADRGREITRLGQDISGTYPEMTAEARQQRAACERDLRLFFETFFPHAFYFAWSEDHLRVIAKLQEAVLSGGLFALAMPRGNGKTALAVRAALWALLYSHRHWVVILSAKEQLAHNLMRDLKTELNNDLLALPFRQVTHCIRALEFNGRRCSGQRFGQDHLTRIGWGVGEVSFPHMPDWALDGKDTSGNIITIAGLTGAIRGLSKTLPSGEVIRPDLVIADDPQTRETAASLTQTDEREAIIKGDVLGLAGPGKKISCIMPCTVVYQGDLADRFTSRKLFPQWHGERTRAIEKWPDGGEAVREQYREIRDDLLRNEKDLKPASDFYRQHQAEIESGAVVTWPDRIEDGDVSAFHSLLNKYFDIGPAAFRAEYQNDPVQIDEDSGELTAEQIMAKLSGIKRGTIPKQATRLTAFIDVQGSLLFYVVCAWEECFSGYVIDYGAYPEQGKLIFTLRDASNTLDRLGQGSIEANIRAGLTQLTGKLLAAEWPRDGGDSLKIERLLIDSAWGEQAENVLQFCRQCGGAAVVPSRGVGIGPAGRPIAEWKKESGERRGCNWTVPVKAKTVVYDVNWWKSFVESRLATPVGAPGCLSLYGDSPTRHRLFADHCKAEFRTKTEGRGRVVYVWKIRPDRRDNHWFDGLVGCHVAASMLGVELAEVKQQQQGQRRVKVTMAEMKARAQKRKGA